MTTIKVGKLPSRTDDKDNYVVTKMNVIAIVWHGRHAILVIKLKGVHLLNVQHQGVWWGARLIGLTDDQASLAAIPFMEAVKAGRDYFEVSDPCNESK